MAYHVNLRVPKRMDNWRLSMREIRERGRLGLCMLIRINVIMGILSMLRMKLRIRRMGVVCVDQWVIWRLLIHICVLMEAWVISMNAIALHCLRRTVIQTAKELLLRYPEDITRTRVS